MKKFNSSSCGNFKSQSQSQGLFEPEPYMLGSSYGVAGEPTSSGRPNQPTGNSIRDCLNWNDDTGIANKSMSAKMEKACTWNSTPTFPGRSMSRPYKKCQAHGYGVPKAYLSAVGGQGQGECGKASSPVPVQCQIAPMGVNPQSLIRQMEPVTVHVKAPMGTFNDGKTPMHFTIDPSKIYGGLTRQK